MPFTFRLAHHLFNTIGLQQAHRLRRSVHENQLQTMFHGNAITGGVFNINMASSQSAVSSPESEPPKKKFRRVMCIESNSGSQEN